MAEEVIDVDIKGCLTLEDQIAFEKATTKGQRRSITRQALRPARRAVQQGYRRSVSENRRHAELAVMVTAWKNGWGGSISINSTKKNAYYLKDDPKAARKRRTKPSGKTVMMRSSDGARKRKVSLEGQATGSMPARPFFRRGVDSQRETAMRISMALIRKHIELAASRNQ